MAVRLSVCVPTYQGAPFLERCLHSLLTQEEVELEVHVGDDASTDGSADVAAAVGDPRIHVHRFEQRAGLAGNWNRTWRLAGGEYVALVGQDDFVEPDWARRLVGLLDGHPEAGLAFGRRRFAFADEESRAVVGDFFENRYPAMLEPFYRDLGQVISSREMIEHAMRHAFEINLIGEPSFVVLRRRHPAVAAGFDARLRQMIDWEFFTRFFVDQPILHCAEVVGTYHIHARASSIENAPLSHHYRELDSLLGVVLERFAAVLTGDEAQRLRARRGEARDLAARHAGGDSGPAGTS